MAKGNSNNKTETKSDFFQTTYSNQTSCFIGHKILKYFNDYHNCHLFIVEVSTNRNLKKCGICKSESIFRQSSTLFK